MVRLYGEGDPMKFKYTGPNKEMTLRGVTFPKNKGVEVLSPNFQAKLAALDYFAEVKPRAKKNDQNKD